MDGSKLVLYEFFMSPLANGLRVMLKMGKVDFERKEVNLGKGEHRQPEYMAKNPRGKVPMLQDGDFFLTESVAIAKYLCNTRPSIPEHLWPKDPIKRAHVNQLLEWFQCHYRPAYSDYMLFVIKPQMTGGEFNPEH